MALLCLWTKSGKRLNALASICNAAGVKQIIYGINKSFVNQNLVCFFLSQVAGLKYSGYQIAYMVWGKSIK